MVVHGACMQADWTPLLRASFEGQYETVKALLADGADVNVEDKVSRGEWCELYTHTLTLTTKT